MSCAAGCALGLDLCYGRANPGACRKVAEGDARYIDLMRRLSAAGLVPPCSHRTAYGCCGSPVRLDCRLLDRDVTEAECRACTDATG